MAFKSDRQRKAVMAKMKRGYVAKWRDKDSKNVGTWEIADVPLDNKKEAEERFLFEIKDRYGLTKKDIKIISIKEQARK